MDYKVELQKQYIETLGLIKGARATKRPEDYGVRLKALLEILRSIEKQMEKVEREEAANAKPKLR